jgi:hypothetical protein
VCRQADDPANVIRRLVSLGQHQSVDHGPNIAPFDGTYDKAAPAADSAPGLADDRPLSPGAAMSIMSATAIDG